MYVYICVYVHEKYRRRYEQNLPSNILISVQRDKYTRKKYTSYSLQKFQHNYYMSRNQ